MSSHESRVAQVLELPKLLRRLAGFAVSEAGQGACLALRPKSDLAEVSREAAFFNQGRQWLEFTGFRLCSFPTLDGVLSFLENPARVLEPEALWALRQALKQASQVVDSARLEGPAGGWPMVRERYAAFQMPAQSLNGLTRCLSDDGYLRDEASPALSQARGELRRLHQQCTRRVKDFTQQHGLAPFLQDDFMTLSSDRYVLPLKANFKGRVQGIIHDYSQTGETCYFEPLFLVELNNRLQELKREEREEERKVLIYLSDLLRLELPGLKEAYALLVETDALQARLALAQAYDGRMVEFGEDKPINLLSARHPLLALAEGPAGGPPGKAGGKTSAVPVDITLKSGQRALIVSGGNAGGKTVCLKTLGIIALMGMCGLPAPVAPGSSLPFWKNIQAFIGDDQSLEDHVSTFTAQIRQLAGLWSGVGPGSLVILDEFGAGTDPAQGAALAQAVLDSLLDRGAHVLAATHFPALKAYALSRPEVRAASVIFDPRTQKPMFRLAYDQVGASRALDVAREHGLPEAILKKAEQYLLLDGDDSAALVERLNSLAVLKEKELDGLKEEREKFIRKRSRLEERFEEERRQLFERLKADSQTVLREWKKAKISHKQALKDLAGVRAALLQKDQPDDSGAAVADIKLLVSGQVVVYAPWGRKGVVLELDSRRNKVRLDLSGVSIWVDLADVLLPDAEKGVRPAAQVAPGPAAQAEPSRPEIKFAQRLDLRGMRADVALKELAAKLDSTILTGCDVLEVVHGRGTGALRREVHEFLRTFPAVRGFKLAPEDQGGDGMTIVELR